MNNEMKALVELEMNDLEDQESTLEVFQSHEEDRLRRDHHFRRDQALKRKQGRRDH